MNRFQLQTIKMYPIAKYVIKYEKEYFKDFYDKRIEQVLTYKRIYKLSDILEEKIVDVHYVFRNCHGKILHSFI